MGIYLDNSATTYVDSRVRKEMEPFFSKDYGNPSSFHDMGLAAKNAIEDSRKKVAGILNASPKEIIFTGSGTESINLAIKGVYRANRSRGNHIITTRTEHHAVLDSCRYLEENEGAKITYLDVDRDGIINLDNLEKSITKDTILISIIYANNEIGTIQPIAEIGKIAKKHSIVFHTDACQAGCSQDLNVKNLGVDLLTLNGSKIYGPKGTGMLFIKSGTKIHPIIHGGGQEFGLRSGTENVPGIVGFAKALETCQLSKEEENKRLTELRDKLISGIQGSVPKTILNGHPTKRLPNNVNISFLDIEGEAILLHLNREGIYASTGSACSSESLEPSYVITSLGLPHEVAHGSIRFSLGRQNTENDIDHVLMVMPGIVKKLRMISPVRVNEDELRR
ncbi:MAG: IscS subfamily cysteine desulfurase [Candidatus Aenigmarchaeota archaeon]|nr:IscS subfamily cysteine desulfurase [Candidatus Aenigmarchaeota archaeon]